MVYMPFRIAGSENCEHDSLVSRGRDSGDNKYLQCRDCGAVIVVEKDTESNERVKTEREEEERDLINRLIDQAFNR